jgi:hypothetical protein
MKPHQRQINLICPTYYWAIDRVRLATATNMLRYNHLGRFQNIGKTFVIV